MHNIIVTIFCLCVIFISCNSDDHIRTYRLPKNVIQKDNSKTKIDTDFMMDWEIPEGWKETEGHSMRLASFSAPFSGGIGDVSITTFGGASGGIAPNVNRWLGQVGLDTISPSEITEMAIKKVGKLGNYSYFKLINDGDVESAILASIFLLEDRTVFVKLSSTLMCI